MAALELLAGQALTADALSERLAAQYQLPMDDDLRHYVATLLANLDQLGLADPAADAPG